MAHLTFSMTARSALLLATVLFCIGIHIGTEGLADDRVSASLISGEFSHANPDHPHAHVSQSAHDDEWIHYHPVPNQMFAPPRRRKPRIVHPPNAMEALKPNPFGHVRKLVLLVRFKGHEERNLPSREDYEILLNKKNGHGKLAPAGSAWDYSREVSYGKLEVSSQVVDWITLPYTEQYYANNMNGDTGRLGGAIRFALEKVQDDHDIDGTFFTPFDRSNDGFADLLGIIHSGFGAEHPGLDVDGRAPTERIWSQKSSMPYWKSDSGIQFSNYTLSSGLQGTSGSAPCTIGLIAHEVAHIVGLPDLYGNQRKGWGNGIGGWGLLGQFAGFGGTGHSPPHLSPWAKKQLGWLDYKTLSEPGTYTIRQIKDSPDVYCIREGFPEGEYLLIENKQPVGFDQEIPSGKGGLAIWHIDDNQRAKSPPGHPDVEGWPNNGKHYKVALVQADGKFDLERGNNIGDAGDLFRQDGVNSISSEERPEFGPYIRHKDGKKIIHKISQISAPDQLMTFRYDVERIPASGRKPTSVPPADQPTVATLGSQLAPSQNPSFTAGTATHQDAQTSYRAPEDHSSLQTTNESTVGVPQFETEFSPAHRPEIGPNKILLTCEVDLQHESTIHVSCLTTFVSEQRGAVTTGVRSSNEKSVWKSSLRVTSTKDDLQLTELHLNCRRRLSKGRHKIHWIVNSQHPLIFPAGGKITVKAFRTPSPSDESSEK